MAHPERDGKVIDANYGSLTTREQEIMRLLAEGFPKKAIAERLCIGYKTVDNHTTKIFKKLSIHTNLELTRYAAKLGLIDVDIWKT